MLRRSVLASLQQANQTLGTVKPGWRLKLYDALRPNAVQSFMVWREFLLQAQLDLSLSASLGSLQECLNHAELANLHPDLYALLAPRVFKFWGVPSDNPATPPPHSTGAAVDLTLENEFGNEVDMGCPVDELSDRARPDFFDIRIRLLGEIALKPISFTLNPNFNVQFSGARELLYLVMGSAGFKQHPGEWWHFSKGDQMWAWLGGGNTAIYGNASTFKPIK